MVRLSETVKVLEFGESALDPELPGITRVEVVLTGSDALRDVGLQPELKVADAELATQVLPLPLVHSSTPVIVRPGALVTIPPACQLVFGVTSKRTLSVCSDPFLLVLESMLLASVLFWISNVIVPRPVLTPSRTRPSADVQAAPSILQFPAVASIVIVSPSRLIDWPPYSPTDGSTASAENAVQTNNNPALITRRQMNILGTSSSTR